MKIYNVEQGTPEWLELRKGKMTASHACEIGNCGKGLDTYILTLMSEYYSSGEREYYTNSDMERGNELEELARSMYEMENDVEIEQVGFVEYTEFAGCSPDGLIGDKGLIEIKCPNDKNYFKFLLKGESAIDSKYLWQMQMQLLVTGRQYVDFIAYNPNFKTPMFLHRIGIDDNKHYKLLSGIDLGTEKIKEIKQQLNE